MENGVQIRGLGVGLATLRLMLDLLLDLVAHQCLQHRVREAHGLPAVLVEGPEEGSEQGVGGDHVHEGTYARERPHSIVTANPTPPTRSFVSSASAVAPPLYGS